MTSNACQTLLNSMKKQGASREELAEIKHQAMLIHMQNQLESEIVKNAAQRFALYGALVVSEFDQPILEKALANFVKEEDLSPDSADMLLFLSHVLVHEKARKMSEETPNIHLETLALQLRDKRDEITNLEKKLAALKEERDHIEKHAATALALIGVKSAQTQYGTLGLSSTKVATIDDWESFTEFVTENNAFHLLERRPAQAGCRELMQDGENIPGIKPFIKTKLTFRRN